MKQPLISVIVPCYNQAQFLDECMQSVLEQTYQNWECIIVNDGSPDNTEEVALEWTKKDVRFIYLKKDNGGLSSARNAGIEKAKGEWILPLDCDDKIGNQYLELAQKEFKNDYTIIYCKSHYFGDKSGEWALPKFSLTGLATQNIIFCTAFYKKEDWQKVGGYDIDMIYGLEDWEFWIHILKPDSEVLQLDYLGFYYRIKAQSMLIELIDERQTQMVRNIERKHLAFFHDNLGTIHKIISERNNLQKTAETHHTTLLAKRYRFIDRLLSYINK